MLPEWPAASLLLRRFLHVLPTDKGLKHRDSAVRLASVEFTGQVAARVWAEALQADREADTVQTVLQAAEAAAGDKWMRSRVAAGRCLFVCVSHSKGGGFE